MLHKFARVLGIIFVVVLVLSTVIKLFSVWGYHFPFGMDQGRDMVDIRRMVTTYTPRLVGPTTSINGVLLGPFYYYLLLPAYIASRGDPLVIAVWSFLLYQISVVILWLVLKKKSPMMSFIVSIFLLLSPTGFYTARFFNNANLMPAFTVLFFAYLFWLNDSITKAKLFFLGIFAGLCLQIEAAFGILFFPFAFVFIVVRQPKPWVNTILTLGFFTTLIPQILFEFRHGFPMTNLFLSEFSGKSSLLGLKLVWHEKVTDRVSLFTGLLRDSNHIPFEILSVLYGILLLVFIIQIINRKTNSYSLISVTFIIIAAVFYFIFPQPIKHWYVLGLSVPIIIFFAGILENLISKNTFGYFFLSIFVIFTFFHVYKAQSEFIINNLFTRSEDPGYLSNEIKAVDWVYQKADNKGFRIYTYLPAIYDFPFQHVFWWYGTGKYGYQPEDIAYLPNQPVYIADQEKAWSKKRPTDAGSPVFLVVQGDGDHQDRLDKWFGNFAHYCLQDEVVIIDSLRVYQLYSCSAGDLFAKLRK